MAENNGTEMTGIGQKLREDYRRHVQSQISRDLVDTLDSLELHQQQLTQLTDHVNTAKKQVSNTASDTKEQINTVFDDVLMSVTSLIEKRRNFLLSEVEQIQDSSVKPLEECEILLQSGIGEAGSSLKQGKHLKHTASKDTITRFQDHASNMNSLPEVPALCAVPYISVEFAKNSTIFDDLNDLFKNFGLVSRMGPVQVTNIQEKAGALLVSWEEVEDDEDICKEFCLEVSNTGAVDSQTAMFHSVYQGSEYNCLVRDRRPSQTYLLRVAARRDGDVDWGPWSLAQSAATSLAHFCWQANDKLCDSWSFADENRLACKLSNDLEVINSNGPQITTSSSVLFKVLHDGVACSDEGLGLSWHPVTKEQLLQPGTLFLNTEGCVFLDGVSRITRLPKMNTGSQVSFTVENASPGKIRVHIESEDKQVTYDWIIPKDRDVCLLYFVAYFVEPNWKVSVH